MFRKVIGPGSRAAHILSNVRDGKISRSDLGVARSLRRSSEEGFLFSFFFLSLFKGTQRFVSLENKGDAYSFDRKSILRRSTLHNLSYVFLSSSAAKVSPWKTRLQTTRVCESLQLAGGEFREQPFVERVGSYGTCNETSCGHGPLF